jgi:hypothetical protein
MSPSIDTLQIKRILPRHVEIMNRLLLGQKQVEISRDMSITEARLSVIINSPLFQLELKKKMLRRAEQVLDLEDNILKGANLGAKFHRDILESPTGTYPTEIKMRAATVMTTIGAKLVHPSNGGSQSNVDELGGKSYEERLREVTFKETVREVKGDNLRDQLAAEEIDDADMIFGDIDGEEEREFAQSTEEVLSDLSKQGEAPSN